MQSKHRFRKTPKLVISEGSGRSLAGPTATSRLHLQPIRCRCTGRTSRAFVYGQRRARTYKWHSDGRIQATVSTTTIDQNELCRMNAVTLAKTSHGRQRLHAFRRVGTRQPKEAAPRPVWENLLPVKWRGHSCRPVKFLPFCGSTLGELSTQEVGKQAETPTLQGIRQFGASVE